MKRIRSKIILTLILTWLVQIAAGSAGLSPAYAVPGLPPVVTTSSGSTAFTAGNNTVSTPVTIDSGITLTDPDDITLPSAIVAITGNLHSGEDILSFINDGLTMGNITASYNALTGVLTMTSSGATATLAQWQSALRSVTYTNSAVTPNSANRTIDFMANDDTASSNTATKVVTVTDVNQTPILTTSGGLAFFSPNTPAPIDPSISVSDLDNSTLASATIAIMPPFNPGEDALAFSNTSSTIFGNITGSYNTGTGVLTLTSAGATATVAQWQNALRAVTYTLQAPITAFPTRIFSFQVSDGTDSSAIVIKIQQFLFVPPNLPPVVAPSGGSTLYTAGSNANPVIVDPGITVMDPDSPTLAQSTIAITANFRAGEDLLAFTNDDAAAFGNIASSYDASTGILTLTSGGASASLSQWQSALRAVTYANSALSPDTNTRSLSFVVNDGTLLSPPAIKTVAVRAVTHLTADPLSLTIQMGQTASATISAHYSDETQVDVTPYTTWTIASSLVAVVNGGTVTPISAGDTVITAVYGNVSTAIPLKVENAPAPTPEPTTTATPTPSPTATPEVTPSPSPSPSPEGTPSPTPTPVPTDESGETASPTPTPTPTPTPKSTSTPMPTPDSTGTPSPTPVPTSTPESTQQPFNSFVSVDRLISAFQGALASPLPSSLSDSQSHWAAEELTLSARIGIVNGYPDGTFHPNSSITRAEFSTLLVRAFQLSPGTVSSSVKDISEHWARPSLELLLSNGILNGYTDGTVGADRNLTRAEMTVILSRILNFKAVSSGGNSAVPTFRDVDTHFWARDAILEAAEAGIIQGRGRDVFKPNDQVTRAEAVVILMRALRTDTVIQELLNQS
ncbi:S-layer homology domain-containing protein [Gorillibacterium timonense]|uniref:S-layer homology domain-containing protein n=1 Tax=Gorillibacterium timonense TaxID=1689269 RepID=UPI00071D5ABB|nr:S-layer homology domain-containing protein [Gorillibacterium timonense]